MTFSTVDFRERVPARLNATFRYSVRGAPARFASATAWGAYAHVYPPRRSHWGPGLISRDFETVVMARNVAHRNRDAAEARAELGIWDTSGKLHTSEVGIPADRAVALRLRERAGVTDGTRLVSWFLRSPNPHLDTFWVSFAPDGRICGDHGV